MNCKIYVIKLFLILFLNTLFIKVLYSQGFELDLKSNDKHLSSIIDLKQETILVLTQKTGSSTLHFEKFTDFGISVWQNEYKPKISSKNGMPLVFNVLNNDSFVFVIIRGVKNQILRLSQIDGSIDIYDETKDLVSNFYGNFYCNKQGLIYIGGVDSDYKIIRINNRLEVSHLSNIHIEDDKDFVIKPIKIIEDTIFAYQVKLDASHSDIRLVFIKYFLNGTIINTSFKDFSMPFHSFNYNSEENLNIVNLHLSENQIIYFYGNLGKKLNKNAKYPLNNSFYGFWVLKMDQNFKQIWFNVYPLDGIFKKDQNIVIGESKFWSTKKEQNDAFFLYVNQIPDNNYKSCFVFLIDSSHVLKLATRMQNSNIFCSPSKTYSKRNIKNTDYLFPEDVLNFYNTNALSYLKYIPQMNNHVLKNLFEISKTHHDESEVSEVVFSTIYRQNYALIIEQNHIKGRKLKIHISKLNP